MTNSGDSPRPLDRTWPSSGGPAPFGRFDKTAMEMGAEAITGAHRRGSGMEGHSVRVRRQL